MLSPLENNELDEELARQDAKTEKPLSLQFIDVAAWDGQPIPERGWAVRNRIPIRQPTLFGGDGAIGKTLALLQLSAAHVLARDWLGMMPEPGPVIYLGAEDEADEIHRRVADIAQHYGVSFSELKDFYPLSLAGEDAALAHIDKTGAIEPTALFYMLQEAACDIRPKMIGLDTASDIFPGDENNRGQVRQFVSLLRGLAIKADAAIVICSHPSLTGISTGSGLSGSTAWHNSVRARMYLKPATTTAGDEPDTELRELQFKKNNYGPIGDRILLRWRNGVFVPEPTFGSLEKVAADNAVDELFMKLLTRFNRQGRDVSHKPSVLYAPKVFAEDPDAAGTGSAIFARAMSRLFDANRIHIEESGSPSKRRSRLAVGPKP